MNRLSLSFNLAGVFFLILVVSQSVYANQNLQQDNQHVQGWNKFVDDALALHAKLTANKKLDIKNRVGSYATNKDFYIESQYYDKGRLISQLQWEKDKPKKIHTIEVYVRDNKGRVIRDFMAAYLPQYRNAPIQTLISFHHYNNNLHAFRSFDASGEIVLERCTGTNAQGQVVNLLLDENELFNDNEGVMESAKYESCFKGLKQNELGKYIIPQ